MLGADGNSGLLASVFSVSSSALSVAKSELAVTLLTSQENRSPLKAAAPSNIDFMVVTLLTSQEETSPLKVESMNIIFMVVTSDTSQSLMWQYFRAAAASFSSQDVFASRIVVSFSFGGRHLDSSSFGLALGAHSRQNHPSEARCVRDGCIRNLV